ncbi:MAG: HlyC/CorC family transporter [Acidobacteria bacterium]|nr:HlyC/CorC family transporter [Acidobacteriota bacterium]
MPYRILLMVAILALNAFFAAAEVSLVSVRRSRLKALADEGQIAAQAALNLLAHPERLLSVTQFGVTLASLGLGWAGEETVFELLMAAAGPLVTPASQHWIHVVAFGLSFLLMSYFHVIIGEVVPKNLAIEKADRMALLVAPVLVVFDRIVSPFVRVMEQSALALSRAIGLRGGHSGGGHSAEELKFIIRSSWSEGHLERFEENAIQKILDLGDFLAREIMVPRNNIVSAPVDASLDDILKVMAVHKHSRIPVYETTPENIVGILNYKDLIRLWQERKWNHDHRRPERPFRIRRFLRKPLVVPETKPVSSLISDFRDHYTHLALVVDEFGTIAGLVTLEDVLEQIFGPMADEHDARRPLTPPVTTEMTVDGSIPIRDLAAMYGLELPSEAGYETLAGFLLYRLGYIPKPGGVIQFEGRRYTILEMERNRISKVRIEKVEAPAA